ncbi:MAG: 16S rRNA (cytidine(1402)-2'-O)-methyltransferase [Armatimonadota bacterium]|nr:16S rRNA (cytidine(1402)-2'-O)-methyltransferase [Armatimonadota bacterium]
MTPGVLYLVATPIGNLEDITLRAVRVLREADVVACEDTRHTRGLLAHLGIRAAVLSLHEHNERTRIPQILGLLRAGKTVALVADAGMPVISDPGAALVAAASREGLRVVSVPGPSAVTAAVPLADFAVGQFAFVGFLPRQRGERRRLLESLVGLPMALVIFEAPHRVREALADLEDVFGGRRLLLARELTKRHEEVIRGTIAEVRAALRGPPRGEVTLVVEGAPEDAAPRRARAAGRKEGVGPQAPEEVLRRLLAEGLSRRDAARALAVACGLPPKEAYRLAAREP